MASFPGSVKTFAVRSNGQTIADTWFNDADDEITAIEDGLRNGTAPLNSSNSTFAALNVTGLSTFAGNVTLGAALSVAGNSTITGSLVCSSLITAAAQPRCSVFSTTQQAVSSASTTMLTFESELYDVGNFHSTSVTPSRITVAVGSSGLYLIRGQAFVGAGFIGQTARLAIARNSSLELTMQRSINSSIGETIQIGGSLFVDGGSFLELAYVSFASTGAVGSAVQGFQTTLEAVRLW